MPDEERLARYYADAPDAEIAEQHAHGPGAFLPEAWGVIANEYERRGLAVALTAPQPPCAFVATTVRSTEVSPHDSYEVESPDSVAARQIRAAVAKKRMGGALLVIGAAITALSYLFSTDGSYVIAVGLIATGVVKIFRGQSRLERAQGIDPLTGTAAPAPCRSY